MPDGSADLNAACSDFRLCLVRAVRPPSSSRRPSAPCSSSAGLSQGRRQRLAVRFACLANNLHSLFARLVRFAKYAHRLARPPRQGVDPPLSAGVQIELTQNSLPGLLKRIDPILLAPLTRRRRTGAMLRLSRARRRGRRQRRSGKTGAERRDRENSGESVQSLGNPSRERQGGRHCRLRQVQQVPKKQSGRQRAAGLILPESRLPATFRPGRGWRRCGSPRTVRDRRRTRGAHLRERRPGRLPGTRTKRRG